MLIVIIKLFFKETKSTEVVVFGNHFRILQICGMVQFMYIIPLYVPPNTNTAAGVEIHLNGWHSGICMHVVVHVHVHVVFVQWTCLKLDIKIYSFRCHFTSE